MKKHIFLILLLLGISLEAFCQQSPKDEYHPLPENKKFEGAYILDDGQQRFVMTLNNRKRVRVVDSHIITDMLEGSISYTKNGKTIMTRTTGDHHIWGGMSGKNKPNVMYARFKDPRRGQSGRVILTLDPKNNTAVLKLKKNPGGVNIITDEASRQRVEQENQKHNRPFVIPDSLVLKKQ